MWAECDGGVVVVGYVLGLGFKYCYFATLQTLSFSTVKMLSII